jgi:hypothetical protein
MDLHLSVFQASRRQNRRKCCRFIPPSTIMHVQQG